MTLKLPKGLLQPLTVACSPLPFPEEVPDVTESSRSVIAGGLFVAVRGTRADGHSYITDAVASGAAGIVLEDRNRAPADSPWIQVRSTRRALGLLAAGLFRDPTADVSLVGITGTNGKTTTSFLLESIFHAAGLKTGLIGTVVQRSPLGERPATGTTPPARDLQERLSLFRDEGAQAVVMEVTSHGLDMERVAGCRFDGALFTNLSRDHLDYHQTMDNYRRVKLGLVSELALSPKPKRWIAWWDGDPAWKDLPVPDGVRTFPYGEGRGEGVRIDRSTLSVHGLSGTLLYGGTTARFVSPLIGRHNLLNIAAASAAAFGMGIAPQTIEKGISRLTHIPGRLERVQASLPFHVFVDYAHTPDALEKVLAALRELNPKRIVTVFGCGGDRDRGKRPLMGAAVARASDVAVVTSDNPRSESPPSIIRDIVAGMADEPLLIITEPDRRRAIETALNEARSGDIVLIAGKGHESTQTVGDLELPFDDRQVVQELVRAL